MFIYEFNIEYCLKSTCKGNYTNGFIWFYQDLEGFYWKNFCEAIKSYCIHM